MDPESSQNEEADRQAKCAVKGDADSPLNRHPIEFHNGLPDSKSAIKQEMMNKVKGDNGQFLHNSPQWRKL